MAFDSEGGTRPPQNMNDLILQDAPRFNAPDRNGFISSNQEDHNIGAMRRPDGEGAHQAAMPSPTRNDQAPISAVSPELIAEITERIKKEVVEHLTKTASLDVAATEKPRYEPPRVESEPPEEIPPQAVRHEPVRQEMSSGDAARSANPSLKSTPTSSPPPQGQNLHTPPSPQEVPKRASSPPSSPTRRSPPNTPSEKPSVRFSTRAMPDLSNRATRPAAPGQTYSTMELNSIDQKWGMLFDKERNPTPRLGQFLRGLANHIIEEFQPKKSIVITPDKMAAFYTNFALEREVHPLISIFKAQSNEHISQLYQDLACPHHLIQEDTMKAPCVPGLTPIGFAQWMTIHILAYPEQEYSRLEKVVLKTPIDADGEMIDGKPERLPKQISRYLLPSKEDRKSRELLEDAIADYLDDMEFSRRRKGAMASPPLSRQTSTTQTKTRPIDIPRPRSPTKPLERERMPYGGTPGTDAPIVELERERQPYTAHPGSGKVYTDGLTAPPTNRTGRANSTSRMAREPDHATNERHVRTQSNTSNSSYVPPPRSGSIRRPPSPPIQKFSQSTPLNLDSSNNFPPPFNTSSSNLSPSSHSSSSGMPPPPVFDLRDREREEDSRRYRTRERRGTQEEMRSDPGLSRESDRWERDANRPDYRAEERSYEDYYRGSGRGYDNGQYATRY